LYPHFSDNHTYMNCPFGTGGNEAFTAGQFFFGCTYSSLNANTGYANASSFALVNGGGSFDNADLIWLADNQGGSGAIRSFTGTRSMAALGVLLNATDEANFCHAVSVYITAVAGAAGHLLMWRFHGPDEVEVCSKLSNGPYTLGRPRRRFRLHPIESFKTSPEAFNVLNRAIGPFGLHEPMLAVFENNAKYRCPGGHVHSRAESFRPLYRAGWFRN
jgi:hypothetical protein